MQFPCPGDKYKLTFGADWKNNYGLYCRSCLASLYMFLTYSVCLTDERQNSESDCVIGEGMLCDAIFRYVRETCHFNKIRDGAESYFVCMCVSVCVCVCV